MKSSRKSRIFVLQLEMRKIKRAQPSLRSRSSYLMSGGWYSALNAVRKSSDLTFSKSNKFIAYRDKPGVRQMVSTEIPDLSRKPIIVPISSKRKNKKVLALAGKMNKEILDAVNKKHAMLCGFPTFNRWTPPAKYLRLRSQCDLNFSVKYNERSAFVFPERRFIRYVNTVNKTEELLIKSSVKVLRISHLLTRETLRCRIRLIKRWLYSISLADYNNNHQRKKIKSNHFTSLKLKKILVSLTKALPLEER